MAEMLGEGETWLEQGAMALAAEIRPKKGRQSRQLRAWRSLDISASTFKGGRLAIISWSAEVDPKDRYIAAAAEHGRCTESGDYKRGNAAYDRMITALEELRGRADRGELVLIELLNHPNGWVRLGAATHLLPLRAELASAILENLASGPRSEVEFEARMILREWRAGRLNVP